MKKFQIQKQNSRFGQIAKKNQLHFQQQQEHFLAKRQKVEAQYQVPIAQQRVKIDRISPYLQNAKIAGKIVNVQEEHSFTTMQECFVQKFIIKDETGTIHCVLWSEEKGKYSNLILIGGLVEIESPEIRSKQENSQFKGAATSSEYELHISKTSMLSKFSGNEKFREPLIRRGWRSFHEITQLGNELINTDISILGCIKEIGPIQEVVTKNGKSILKRQLFLFDHTGNQLEITLWGIIAQNFDKFLPMETIVLATDVKISLFKNSFTGTIGFRSLIDVNPNLNEANLLFDYSQTVDVTELDNEKQAQEKIDISKINTRLTIERLHDQLDTFPKGKTQFAFGYYYLTKFDIDNEFEDKSIVMAICNSCNEKVSPTQPCPCNSNESEIPSYLLPQTKVVYHLCVSLTDSTGTWTTYLPNSLAINLIGFPPEEFCSSTLEEKTFVKVSKLFEKFAIFWKIEWRNGVDEKGPNVSIVECLPLKR